MKINEIQNNNITEDHVDIYYRKKTREIHEILNYLMKHRHRLVGKEDDREHIFSLHDVYYFESVDKKTFAYLDHHVLRIELRLQDLEMAYVDMGFIRVNKSTILNVYKIDTLKSELNMRVMAVLDNGEQVQINRSYKGKFNACLHSIMKGVIQNETDS